MFLSVVLRLSQLGLSSISHIVDMLSSSQIMGMWSLRCTTAIVRSLEWFDIGLAFVIRAYLGHGLPDLTPIMDVDGQTHSSQSHPGVA